MLQHECVLLGLSLCQTFGATGASGCFNHHLLDALSNSTASHFYSGERPSRKTKTSSHSERILENNCGPLLKVVSVWMARSNVQIHAAKCTNTCCSKINAANADSYIGKDLQGTPDINPSVRTCFPPTEKLLSKAAYCLSVFWFWILKSWSAVDPVGRATGLE